MIDSPDDLEVICIKLDLNNPVTICVIYILYPLAHLLLIMMIYSTNLHSASDELITVGDLKFPDIDWDTLTGQSPASNRFCDLVFQTTHPTHNQAMFWT